MKTLPKDFEKAYKELPEAAACGTADPIWILYDYIAEIPEAAFEQIEYDDRVEYRGADDEPGIFYAGTDEPVSDEWLVDNGYAVWVPRFYGAYTTKEEAYKALETRPYAFKKPVIYCESLFYSDPALKWLIRSIHYDMRSI
ncbi:hypothetical protein [Nitrosophilus kaiyonis]|uniref:hypothetical protein n=1 Tax=Nitrosophilus kaiyonis TaxID=2930200 RepID=UPI002490C858|nr:hypothetical protein [Nitrosophilus kaiyonis]